MAQPKTAFLQDFSGLRWDDIRIFLQAYRAGTLGSAAQKLGVDTSTMSRRLSVLEDALGKRLFERTRQGLVSTRAAELVLPAAEAMEAAFGRLTRDVSGLETKPEGVVRVSAAPGMTDIFVAPALPALRAKYPALSIELDAQARVVNLSRHEADIALRSVPPSGADLVITKLISAPWIIAASRARAEELGKLTSWDAAPWIAWDSDSANLHVAKWLARHVPRADVVLRTSHFASQLAAVEVGLGLALVPEPYARVRKLVQVRYVSSLPGIDELPLDSLWLASHRVLRDVPRVAAVWDFLAELFRGPKKRSSKHGLREA